MDERHSPFRRTGEPGGPGARVGVLPIPGRLPDGVTVDAELLGWWAVVPKALTERE